MKDRVLKLITHLGYTATRFADELGVQRSGISHILSGRNQPSFDFIVKILQAFPDLDAEWLILGKGQMFKAKKQEDRTVSPDKRNTYITHKEQDLFTVPIEHKESETTNQFNPEKVTNVTTVNHVIVLSSDGTFDVYNPAKKD